MIHYLRGMGVARICRRGATTTTYLVLLWCAIGCALAAGPAYLQRFVPGIGERPDDLTTPTCHYQPVFGLGDAEGGSLSGMVRFGQMTVDPGGASARVSYPHEEQIYYVLDGTATLHYGGDAVPVNKDDFLYLPPGMPHGLANTSRQPCRILVIGFETTDIANVAPASGLLSANSADVELQPMPGHPPSSLFKLLMGDRQNKTDKLAAAVAKMRLFIIDFAAGGTNLPHRHRTEDELYLLLSGYGEMVAGGDVQAGGVRHRARAGDAYFFPVNTTVGFYSDGKDGEAHARILAVPWFDPSMNPGVR